MANKQIIDYSAGSFDSTSVTLSQPAAGGLYTKKNLLQLLGFSFALIKSVQTGTGNPALTAQYNTTGKTFSAVRDDIAEYTISPNTNFADASKVFVLANYNISDGDGEYLTIDNLGVSSFKYFTTAGDGTQGEQEGTISFLIVIIP